MSIKSYLYNQYRCFVMFKDGDKKYLGKTTKGALRRFWEAQYWFWRQGEFCSFYNAWGLNAREEKLSSFLSRKDFLKVKKSAEEKMKRANILKGFDYEVVTKDKFVASSFFRANAIPCAQQHGLIVNGEFLHDGSFDQGLLDLLIMERELFFKSVALEASDGVLSVKYQNEVLLLDGLEVAWQDLEHRISKGVWLVQGKLVSHEKIRRLNSSALNTTRIVTVIKNGAPTYLTGFQALATGEAVTDAWGRGSIYVGIDIQGSCLKEHGFHNLSDKKYAVSFSHPDSGILFKGYEIPMLKDAVSLCLCAHRLLYNNFVIGWDIAITDAGPILVEANEKPGMNAAQCVDGGLRRAFMDAYNTIKSDR